MASKNGKKAIIHCCVERDVHELLMEHCARTGQTKTMAIRRAIQSYCEKHGVTKDAAKGDGSNA